MPPPVRRLSPPLPPSTPSARSGLAEAGILTTGLTISDPPAPGPRSNPHRWTASTPIPTCREVNVDKPTPPSSKEAHHADLRGRRHRGIGRALLPLLHDHTVVGMTRSRPELVRALGAELAVCDVYDRRRVFAVVKAACPVVVVDLLTDLAAWEFAANNRIRRGGTQASSTLPSPLEPQADHRERRLPAPPGRRDGPGWHGTYCASLRFACGGLALRAPAGTAHRTRGRPRRARPHARLRGRSCDRRGAAGHDVLGSRVTPHAARACGGGVPSTSLMSPAPIEHHAEALNVARSRPARPGSRPCAVGGGGVRKAKHPDPGRLRCRGEA